MNEIIEKLSTQHASLLAEEKQLKAEISAIQDKQRNIVREYCQHLTDLFSQYLGKKVTIGRYNRRTVTGIFCGFKHGYSDLVLEAYVDLAKIKKDGSPSANHYQFYDSVSYSENLKITLCDDGPEMHTL